MVDGGLEIVYQPHPLCPPLHDMDMYSYHEGEGWILKGFRPFMLPQPLHSSLNVEIGFTPHSMVDAPFRYVCQLV